MDLHRRTCTHLLGNIILARCRSGKDRSKLNNNEVLDWQCWTALCTRHQRVTFLTERKNNVEMERNVFFWLGLSLLSDSSSQDAHFPHCDRNHGYQRHPDLGLRQPRTCVLLCYSVSCQIVWERFPGSRWCRHNPLQHWWPQPLLWIRVSCHGCEQRWPGSSQQHRGHPYKWASTLITTSSCPGTHAELQHHAGPVGASRRAQWPNPGLSGLLQLRSRCPAQRLAEAQHRWQPFHHHLRPGNRYHLQPEGAGLHLSGRWASVWHSTDQNQAGRWEHAHYITAEQCIISSVRLAQIIGEVKVIQIIYCVHVLANAACCCISKLQLEHLRPLKHFFTLIFSSCLKQHLCSIMCCLVKFYFRSRYSFDGCASSWSISWLRCI